MCDRVRRSNLPFALRRRASGLHDRQGAWCTCAERAACTAGYRGTAAAVAPLPSWCVSDVTGAGNAPMVIRPSTFLQVADLARKKQSCAHCVTAGFAPSNLQLSRAVMPDFQRSAPAGRQGCFVGPLQGRKSLSRHNTELLSQSGVASHSWRPVGPLPAGMDALSALPLAEATAHLQKAKRVELQKLAKEAGTKVWTLGSVVHA